MGRARRKGRKPGWRQVQPEDSEYIAYLKSPQWRAKRKRLLALRGNRCEVCGLADELHLHHLSYARLYDEHDADLAVICRGCHAAIHGQWGVVRSIGAKRHEQATRLALAAWKASQPERPSSPPSATESVPWGKDATGVAWADGAGPSLKDKYPGPLHGATR